MNILIFSWRGPGHPHAGGAETVTHEHAKAWVRAGHKVTLFTSYFPGARKQEVIAGVNIVRQGNELLGVHLAAPFWYFANRPFDLVIDQFHGIPFFTPLFACLPAGRCEKILGFIHEVAKEVWFLNHLPRPLNWIVGGLGYLVEPWIFRLLYRKIPFMTVSESTKKDLVSWDIPAENISVIHNGVRVIRPNPMPQKEKKPTIIFLGPLARDKGIEDAIEAFSLIAKKLKNAQFWVVGRGDEKNLKFLISNAQKLGLEGKIKFWGYVSEKKKFELLARAYVLVNPSVREGWGLVNIEANAVGTPVVTYNVAGCRDSVKHGKTGLLAKASEPRSLAENILKLVKNPRLYEKLQANALVWGKNFKWEKSGKESEQLLRRIVRER